MEPLKCPHCQKPIPEEALREEPANVVEFRGALLPISTTSALWCCGGDIHMRIEMVDGTPTVTEVYPVPDELSLPASEEALMTKLGLTYEDFQ